MIWQGKVTGKVTGIVGMTDGTHRTYVSFLETNGTNRDWEIKDTKISLGVAITLNILWDSLVNKIQINMTGYSDDESMGTVWWITSATTWVTGSYR
ncbi:hypothetical protein [Paramesorhizobium deserti]|uniref:hypothetical protein n=1 Tax=Paramesorhizobium deserti TaxID=1494590 RepID=UPI0012902FA9|nr:hypothetical protein [Paramesorhizobium deserti]